MTVTAYALRDPRTREVRYIGISKDPSRRLAGHLYVGYRAEHPKGQWLRELRAVGLRPDLVTLTSSTPIMSPDALEGLWTAAAEMCGARLTVVGHSRHVRAETEVWRSALAERPRLLASCRWALSRTV